MKYYSVFGYLPDIAVSVVGDNMFCRLNDNVAPMIRQVYYDDIAASSANFRTGYPSRAKLVNYCHRSNLGTWSISMSLNVVVLFLLKKKHLSMQI